jgi:hypothetical protein
MEFDGSSLQTIILSGQVISAGSKVRGIALDLASEQIYWADTGGNAGVGQGGSAVSRGDLDGSTPMEILASGTEPWDVELDRRCRNYDEWRRRCFRIDATPEQTSPSANPEGYLFNTVQEYFFDLAPLHPDGQGISEALLVSGSPMGSLYPAIRYHRRAGTTDLTSSIQVSTNLIDWQGSLADPATVEVLVNPLEDGMVEVTARGLAPVSESPVSFMRVMVSCVRARNFPRVAERPKGRPRLITS